MELVIAGLQVKYDEIDHDLVSRYKWGIIRGRSKVPYVSAGRSEKGPVLLMHRVIMDVMDKKGLVVDHINKDTLDNRRENLRVVTQKQNCWNRKLQQGAAPNTSGYRCAFLNKDTGTWFCQIAHNGRSLHLGTWPTPEEAARAHDRAVKHLRGDFGILNFPDEDPGPLEDRFIQKIANRALVE